MTEIPTSKEEQDLIREMGALFARAAVSRTLLPDGSISARSLSIATVALLAAACQIVKAFGDGISSEAGKAAMQEQLRLVYDSIRTDDPTVTTTHVGQA